MFLLHLDGNVVYVMPDEAYSDGAVESFGAEGACHCDTASDIPDELMESYTRWVAHDEFLRNGEQDAEDVQDALVEVAELTASNEATLDDVVDALMELADMIGGNDGETVRAEN